MTERSSSDSARAAMDAAIKGLTGLFSILRGKSYAKDHYQIEISHGLYNELRDARDDLVRVRDSQPARCSAGTSSDSAHYLHSIRDRLDQLYALVDDPRTREQLSDEVDWVEAQISATQPATRTGGEGYGGWSGGDTPEEKAARCSAATAQPKSMWQRPEYDPERSLLDAVHDLAQAAWKCLAPSKAACAWPDCGCDPEATKVIKALVDQGWQAPAISSTQSEGGK